MINMQPGGRFQVCKTPPNLPGKCVVCGAWGGDGRDFVDFGFDIDFYGTVYFCSCCLTECTNKLGYISPTQWTSVNNMNDELITRVQTLEADNALLRTALSATDFLRGGFDPPVANATDNEESDLAFEGIASEPDLFSGTDDIRKESDDSESNGSSDERGHSDVQSDVVRESDDFGFDWAEERSIADAADFDV